MFLEDCWYVAAWSRELSDGLVARTILDRPVVLFRAADGRPAALEDRCCHRSLPLSRGELIGDVVQCGYHGLRFDRAGQCVRVPGQTAIPPGARVESYPVVEKWRWIWIWMGDPARADESLVPDFHWNDDPGWTAVGGVYRAECDYRLIVDNLMDLSHIQFVHASTLGAPADSEADTRVERGPGNVFVSRWVLDTAPSPMYAAALGADDNVDRWQNITYTPPSSIVIDAGSALAGTGAPEGDRSRGVEIYSNHSMTPETGRATHYFWHQARNFKRDDESVSAFFYKAFDTALGEDVATIEAQQRCIDALGHRPTVDINADAGVAAARRLLDRLIAGEGRARAGAP